MPEAQALHPALPATAGPGGDATPSTASAASASAVSASGASASGASAAGGEDFGVGTPAALMARAAHENFPVASVLLPSRVRAHLLAIYGFARLVDELGDVMEGSVRERLSALDWLEAELDDAYAGRARHPLLRALEPTLAACRLPREPFLRLIEANRQDQRVTRYETFEELLAYCALSANPVGELVLGVFGLATPERVALSDRVCSALQLAEHWQDVAEDRGRGRVYLPAQDMRRFGVSEVDLDAAHAAPHVRELIAFEVMRARGLLVEGLPLLDTLPGGALPGRMKLAVAAYAGGGLAALEAIEAAGFDVLACAPRAGRWRRAAGIGQVLAARERDRMAEAWRECEALTRREARNFYWGIRLLPRVKRRAICAVYAFARRVDDIGDGALSPQEKLRRLDVLARELDEALAGRPDERDPALVALAAASERFRLPADALRELIEGVRMDVRGERYEGFDELVVYCRRVAGGVGRLCLAIFGVRDPRAASWAAAAADELGVAMQLTNILRDVREDAGRGRVYLPREDLMRFGLGGDVSAVAALLLAADGPRAQLEAAIAFEADRAREWFARGASLLGQLDRRSAACVLAMAGIYGRLLDRIAACPSSVLDERVALPRAQKIAIAAASLIGVGP